METNTTPPVTPPVIPPPETKPGLPDSFLKSLKTVLENEKTPPVRVPNDGPGHSAADVGGSHGSLSDVIRNLPKKVEEKPIVETPVVPPVEEKKAPVVSTKPKEVPVVDPVRDQVVDQLKQVKTSPITPAPIDIPRAIPVAPTVDIAGLDEDEQMEVETARFAEMQHPDKYKGHAAKVAQFIKDHKKLVNDLQARGIDDIEENSQYKNFVNTNRPDVSKSERRRLENERVAYEAAQRARQEVDKELSELRRQVAETRATPQVERAVDDFKKATSSIIQAEDPLGEEIRDRILDQTAQAANEFLRLSNRLTSYDPNNQTHRWLGDFIEQQADTYSKSQHGSLKRGTQTFVSRAKFNTMPVDDRQRHFTFSDDDVLRILAANAKQVAESAATTERARIEKLGYGRTTTTAKTLVTSPSGADVKLPPSPRGGAAPTSSNVNDLKKPKDKFLGFLTGDMSTT